MVGGVNLRIVRPTAAARAAGGHKATVSKRDVIVPALTEEERTAAAAEGGGGLGLLGPTRRVCLVCKARASAYSCPRCATPYCSAACYKGHNAGCTEGFYRRHVEGEVRLRDAAAQADGAGKRAAVEALRRVRLEGEGAGDAWLAAAVGGGGQGEGGEDEEELLGEARLAELAALAEAGRLDLGALTLAEQQAFLRAVASGEAGQGLEVWRAWWEGPPALAPGTGAPLVVVEEGEEGEERPVALPSLWRGLERWRRGQNVSTSKPEGAAASPSPAPSPLLRYHLLDVLFSYAAVLRTYNGQWAADPPQAAADLLALSAVLAAAGDSGGAGGGKAKGKGKEAGKGQPGAPTAVTAAAVAALPASAAGALAASLAALQRWDGAAAAATVAPPPQQQQQQQQQQRRRRRPDGVAPEVSPALAMGLALARDVAALLGHGTLVACALLDAYRLVRAAAGEVLADDGGGRGHGHEVEQVEEEDGIDLAALAARMERALGGKGGGGGGGGGGGVGVGPEEKERRRRRRHEGRRLVRVLHKLRFLLAWADGGSRRPQQQQDAAAAWLLPLRAEVLVALREHEAVVVAGGSGEPRIKVSV